MKKDILAYRREISNLNVLPSCHFVEFEIFAIIGWMGGFLSMVIMGILIVMNKE